MRASWQRLVGALVCGTWGQTLTAAGIYGAFGVALLVVAGAAIDFAREGEGNSPELHGIAFLGCGFAAVALWIVAAAVWAMYIKFKADRLQRGLAPIDAGPSRITQVHVGFRDEA